MNTLSKTITATFFKDPAGYQAMKQAWAKQVHDKKELTAEAHLLYLILCGKDWRRAFVVGQNLDIENGQHYSCGPYRTVNNLTYELTSPYANGRIFGYLGTDNYIWSDNVKELLLVYLPVAEEVRKAILAGKELPNYA